MPPEAQPPGPRILVVEPHKPLADTLQAFLTQRGYAANSCTTVIEAYERCSQTSFDLVLADVSLVTKHSPLEKLLKSSINKTKVVVMTPFSSISEGLELTADGATDCIVKPFQLHDLARVVDDALFHRHRRASDRTATSVSPPRSANENGNGKGCLEFVGGQSSLQKIQLIGESPAIKQLNKRIDRIAATDCYALIVGTTGTGKELVARAIHERSSRCNAPFVDVNCSAVPDTLFESEFFGHQRGTFTGAYETRRGLFEKASGGTLFLDEVDTLNLAAQAKLLRVLQEHQLRRVGGRENISVDVRIIAATNRDLKLAIKEGTFRADLFFRLRVVPIHVPDLCDRAGDIAILADHFLREHAQLSRSPVRRLSRDALRVLTNYRWPGNVRELQNVIEYALALSSDREMGVDALPPDMLEQGHDTHNPLTELISDNAPLEEMERRYIITMFERYDRHHINTATALGIDRRTLYRKLQQYNLGGDPRGKIVNLP